MIELEAHEQMIWQNRVPISAKAAGTGCRQAPELVHNTTEVSSVASGEETTAITHS